MDDVLQEAYVKAFRSLPRFRGRSTLGTWLYRIVYNACLDELRRLRANPTVSLEHASDVGTPGPAEAVLGRSTLAGLGNIYVDEALWRARIHPLRPARELAADDVRALREGIKRALEVGIKRQGATLRDYRQPYGNAGSMQQEFKVYGRLGEPCDRCGTPIEKTRVAGRGTWYCPACQRR